jgi:hypothetical protein
MAAQGKLRPRPGKNVMAKVLQKDWEVSNNVGGVGRCGRSVFGMDVNAILLAASE